jgi:hypothetical protein
MPKRIADLLAATRKSRFVGREQELTVLREALHAPVPPFSVLSVYGPGGVGKTTLLRAFADLSREAGLPTYRVDARDIEPTPDGFTSALRSAMRLSADAVLSRILSTAEKRLVILIDTYELLRPLDNWLRDTFLPELPGDLIVVIAGRNPLPASWHADPGWRPLLRTLPLRNFDTEESRTLLYRRGIPLEQYDAILNFTFGHPLALSLAADVFDQRPDWTFSPDQAPDFIKTLLDKFVQKVPSPAHRTALEACAIMRLTTETLLQRLMDMPDVHDLFEWLRSLSFIESGPYGLYPHDLAREALRVDLQWRNPDWHAELHDRARTYFSTRLEQTRGREQQRVLLDYVFLHRYNPVMRPFLEWQQMGGLFGDRPREADWPALRDMVMRHEGAESAECARRWFERQPEGVLVFREGDTPPAGFMITVTWTHEHPIDPGDDPAVEKARAYLEARAPLRPGERAAMFRFWMGDEAYQSVSPAQSFVFLNIAQYYLTTPDLAFSFFPCADAGFWSPFCEYVNLDRLPEVDFVSDGRPFGVYGHDWRSVPPMAWLSLLAQRELAQDPEAIKPPATEALIVLSEANFRDAVWNGLRSFARPHTLRDNPLLRSRLIVEACRPDADDADRIETLRNLLSEAAGKMNASPRDVKFFRVLERTYLNPAESQEMAAESLNLPFSTYRRYLKKGISFVAATLWEREIGTPISS